MTRLSEAFFTEKIELLAYAFLYDISMLNDFGLSQFIGLFNGFFLIFSLFFLFVFS